MRIGLIAEHGFDVAATVPHGDGQQFGRRPEAVQRRAPSFGRQEIRFNHGYALDGVIALYVARPVCPVAQWRMGASEKVGAEIRNTHSVKKIEICGG